MLLKSYVPKPTLSWGWISLMVFEVIGRAVPLCPNPEPPTKLGLEEILLLGLVAKRGRWLILLGRVADRWFSS